MGTRTFHPPLAHRDRDAGHAVRGLPCTNQPLDPNQGEISNFQGNGAVQTGPYSVEL